jgi:hypothetical protein
MLPSRPFRVQLTFPSKVREHPVNGKPLKTLCPDRGVCTKTKAASESAPSAFEQGSGLGTSELHAVNQLPTDKRVNARDNVLVVTMDRERVLGTRRRSSLACEHLFKNVAVQPFGSRLDNIVVDGALRRAMANESRQRRRFDLVKRPPALTVRRAGVPRALPEARLSGLP